MIYLNNKRSNFYSCTECPSSIEILSLKEGKIEFRCNNIENNHGVIKLPLNEYLAKIQSNKNIQFPQKCCNCSKISDSKFKYFYDCDAFLCSDKCVKEYEKKISKQNNSANNENSKCIRCQKFETPAEDLKFYCFNCKLHLCDECIKSHYHINHRRLYFFELTIQNDEINNIRTFINKLINEIKIQEEEKKKIIEFYHERKLQYYNDYNNKTQKINKDEKNQLNLENYKYIKEKIKAEAEYFEKSYHLGEDVVKMVEEIEKKIKDIEYKKNIIDLHYYIYNCYNEYKNNFIFTYNYIKFIQSYIGSDISKIILNKINNINYNLYSENIQRVKNNEIILLGKKRNNYQNLIEPQQGNKIKILYKCDNEKKEIQLFGNNFVKRNKNRCYILINNNKIDLINEFKYNKDDLNGEGYLEVILKERETINDMSEMFSGCDQLIGFSNKSNDYYWDTSSVTNMRQMFGKCKELIKLDGISKWDISKVTNLSQMFYCCQNLISLPDISNWDTRNVINMSHLFYYCSKLKYLPDISKWNTSKVENMESLFNKCENLLSFPDISKWNTSKVENMKYMFNRLCLLQNLPDLSQWNISKVKDIQYIFEKCESLTSLPDISKWDTSNIENMDSIFCGCSKLSSLPDLSKWKTTNLKSINFGFLDCYSLNYLPDISTWDTSNIMDMDRLFKGCENLKSLPDLSKWDISKVENLFEIFMDCKQLASLPDLSKWDTSHVTNIENLFNGCSSLTSINCIYGWNTKNIIKMNGFIRNCKKLSNKTTENLRLRWDMSSAKSIDFLI